MSEEQYHTLNYAERHYLSEVVRPGQLAQYRERLFLKFHVVNRDFLACMLR